MTPDVLRLKAALKALLAEFEHISSVDHDQEDWPRAQLAMAAAHVALREAEAPQPVAESFNESYGKALEQDVMPY